jgi:cob(I)alamin adenosyltransferase
MGAGEGGWKGMRLYTRTGDGGETSLWRERGTPRRVAKDDLRVDAYGSVDEANSAIGLAKSLLEPDFGRERALLDEIQSALFALGSELATPDLSPQGYRMRDEDATALEGVIDAFEGGLDRLRSFILPDGVPAAAALHVARTAVRRAERATVRLGHALPPSETLNPAALRYLNRLSDLLFVLARHVNARAGVGDRPVRIRPPAEL